MRQRVTIAEKYVFGPGKADLLEAIDKTGSLAGAARSMGMSYMRAWTLVQELQQMFAKPAVELHRGGKTQGATLTTTGSKALALYREMEAEAMAATEGTWRKFKLMVGKA